MTEISTILFVDEDSGSDATIVVRAGEARVAVCISLRENGDAEVVMGLEECKNLIGALQRAASMT